MRSGEESEDEIQICILYRCRNKKKTNQDSLCISEASTPQGDAIMAAVCDGMGGLIKGELASKTIIEALESWFADELPEILRKSDPAEEALNSWYELICRENERILSYGKNTRCSWALR